MYYPYLRGKQFELLALRDFADYYGETKLIIPIIEPVKNSFNGMKLAIRKMHEKGIHFNLILNPQCGDVQNEFDLILDSLGLILQIKHVGLLPSLLIITIMIF